MTRGRGLTLTEFVLATSIVLVIASVAVPHALTRRMQANESSAIAALGQIASAQARFQAAGYVDINQNGVGEYGLWRELTGVVGVRSDSIGRTQGDPRAAPLLSRKFSRFTSRGEVSRAGYLFHVLLPGRAGFGVHESRGSTSFFAAIDSELAETAWGCYAWPVRHGVSGARTFFTNQTGDVVATNDARYSGPGKFGTVHAGAAFVAGGEIRRMTGQIATGTRGRDGNVWRLTSGPRIPADLRSEAGSHEYGGFSIVLQRPSFRARETLSVWASRDPGSVCEILLTARSGSPSASFGFVTANVFGRLEFQFDSRVDTYPDGVTTLADFATGRLTVTGGSNFYWWQPGEWRIPPFVPDPSADVRGKPIDEIEETVVATLREIAVAQARFKASSVCDVDEDGIGEFGLFRELSGAVGVRDWMSASTQGSVLNPPHLPRQFGVFNANHEVSRSGYLFHIILPGAGGIGVLEISGTQALAAYLDTDLAETTWCCYAWPIETGRTGTRTFFINQTGDIVGCDNGLYSGTGDFTASSAGSAFRTGGALTNITGQVAVGTLGRDGITWRAVPNRPDEHAYASHGQLAPGSTFGAAASEFTVVSDQRPAETNESLVVRVEELSPDATASVWLVSAAGDTAARFGSLATVRAGRGLFVFDVSGAYRFWHGRYRYPDAFRYPPGIDTVTAFAGGTLEVRDAAGVVVLRGAIPPLATVGGPAVPGSSVMFRAKANLDPAAPREIESGRIDVGVTNEPGGARETLRISVTTFDVAEGRLDVVAIGPGGAETPLGSIVPHGFDGAGALDLDSRRGRPVPGGVASLSGLRIEVRSRTGDVVVAGMFPIVR